MTEFSDHHRIRNYLHHILQRGCTTLKAYIKWEELRKGIYCVRSKLISLAPDQSRICFHFPMLFYFNQTIALPIEHVSKEISQALFNVFESILISFILK